LKVGTDTEEREREREIDETVRIAMGPDVLA
jgi:hypothetical protein